MGSPGGVQAAAVLFSITSTCQRHPLDAFAYLRDVLTRLAAGPLAKDDLASLLPARWQAPPAE